jgi:hypothetical protein
MIENPKGSRAPMWWGISVAMAFLVVAAISFGTTPKELHSSSTRR